MKPIAIDLYCGLGGWTEGLLAEGYDVVGFDIERHQYGDQRYPAQLVLQDVLTIHGSQFKNASLIVASPPCQAYSYMAMPWSRAKQIAEALRIGETNADFFPVGYSGPRTTKDLNALFSACFRIQREACEAAGRYIPMVVENVKGAQPWVGPAKAHYGSFYLWGDVDMVGDRIIAGGLRFDGIRAGKRGRKIPTDCNYFRIDGSVSPHFTNASEHGRKVPGMNFHEFEKTGKPGRSFESAAVDGTKQEGSGAIWFDTGIAKHSSGSSARKQASAQIAKIPLPLSSYIARSYRPPPYDPHPANQSGDTMTRHEAIFRDVPRFIKERRKLLEAIAASTDPAAIAIMLRRVDKIEERFDEVSLNDEGQEK